VPGNVSVYFPRENRLEIKYRIGGAQRCESNVISSIFKTYRSMRRRLCTRDRNMDAAGSAYRTGCRGHTPERPERPGWSPKKRRSLIAMAAGSPAVGSQRQTRVTDSIANLFQYIYTRVIIIYRRWRFQKIRYVHYQRTIVFINLLFGYPSILYMYVCMYVRIRYVYKNKKSSTICCRPFIKSVLSVSNGREF